MSRKHINEALFLARVYWGKSQVEMAKDLEISQSYLSDIESSNRNVDVALLEKYSKALNVPKSTFLIFSENLEGRPSVRNGRYVVADWALRILEKLVPHEILEDERKPFIEAQSSQI